MLKAVSFKGVTCKRLNEFYFQASVEHPLPSNCLVESKPFTISRVNYTGALLVKLIILQQNICIVLFTCTITRAVHLEIVEEAFCEAFIKAL